MGALEKVKKYISLLPIALPFTLSFMPINAKAQDGSLVPIALREVMSYCKKKSCDDDYARYLKNIDSYRGIVELAAKMFGLDYCILAGLIAIESKGNPNAYSSKGAAGPVQLMKFTARKYGLEINGFEDWRFSPFSVIAGAAEIKEGMEKYGSLENALVAYVAGEDKVGRWNRMPIVRQYIENVFETINACYKIEKSKENKGTDYDATDYDAFSRAKVYNAKYGDSLRKLIRICGPEVDELNPQVERSIDVLRVGQLIFLPEKCKLGREATLEEKVKLVYGKDFENFEYPTSTISSTQITQTITQTQTMQTTKDLETARKAREEERKEESKSYGNEVGNEGDKRSYESKSKSGRSESGGSKSEKRIIKTRKEESKSKEEEGEEEEIVVEFDDVTIVIRGVPRENVRIINYEAE
ncbi:MAG: transglycosylase SLT domain-containing protein [Candidatus Pacearchaeota archaeon]